MSKDPAEPTEPTVPSPTPTSEKESTVVSFEQTLKHTLEQTEHVEEIAQEDLPTEIEEHSALSIATNTDLSEDPQGHVEPALVEEDYNDASDTGDTIEWGRLHPYSLLINLLPQMGRTIQNAWPLLLFIIVGSNDDASQVVDSIFVLFFVGLSILRTFIHFLTLRYSMQDGKLIVKMGLIFRQARTLDPERIQNIEITQNLLHKYFDLVELRIETAGDASTKGLLSALSHEDAQTLKQALQRSKRHTSTEDERDIHPIKTQSWGELILFGFSKRTVGTILILSAVLSEATTIVDPQEAQAIASSMNLTLFTGFVAVSFSVAWLWSALQAILRFHRLEVRTAQEEISIESGLITRRSIEIPRHKIQIIEWFEPWLRRQMGYGSIYLETAALGLADGQLRKAEGVIPMVTRDEMPDILESIAPRTSREILNMQTHAPHKLARLPISTGYLFPYCLALTFVGWSVQPTMTVLSLIAFLGLLVVVGLTELDFRKQMWAITDTAILSRVGYLNRRTWILDRQKIQNVYYEQGPTLQVLGLARVVIDVAGSAIDLPLVDVQEAQAILELIREEWLAA